jgi:hypothetical protein
MKDFSDPTGNRTCDLRFIHMLSESSQVCMVGIVQSVVFSGL